MKKTVLEKENKYKKAQNIKTAVTVTIYTLALSIGLSAASFALFNKLKKMIGELPAETPVETIVPTESIEPTEIPIESIEPTETASPEPTMTNEEYLIQQEYVRNTLLYSIPTIFKLKVSGEEKTMILIILRDQVNGATFYSDFFSFRPIIARDVVLHEGEALYYGIGPLKGATVEIETWGTMEDYDMKRIFGIYGFDISKYPTVGDLRKWYDSKIPESERIEQLPVLGDLTGIEDIIKWNEDYDGYTISNSNTDYINNVTLSASSKESLNNKLIARGLLKDVNDSNIIEVQKIKIKKLERI